LTDIDCCARANGAKKVLATHPETNIAANSLDRVILTLSLPIFYTLQQNFCLGRTKLSGASVPVSSRGKIAAHPGQTGPRKKHHIVGFAQSERSRCISGTGGALVKEACRCHVAHGEQSVGSLQ
jgi:hypothetical protein